MPASTILLLDADADYAESISSVLTAVGYSVTTTADADEAFTLTPDNHLVILDVVDRVANRRRVVPRDQEHARRWPAIPVLCIGQSDDVEERIGFLEAGADDVIAKPFDPRELEARVEALLLRFQRSKDLAPDRLRRRPDAGQGPPDGRLLQPEGWRRDDDHRGQHRRHGRAHVDPTRSS